MRTRPLSEYISHLANDANPNLTACGELWQLWQQPFDADLAGNNAIAAGPSQPPTTGDTVRLCGACLKLAMS